VLYFHRHVTLLFLLWAVAPSYCEISLVIALFPSLSESQ